MLLALGQMLYADAPYAECYAQDSYISMLLYTESLYIVLAKIEGAYCDFPPGVLVTLRFVNSYLDTYYIFNNFNFSTDTYLIVDLPCSPCDEYEAVRNVEITISSPLLQTTFMAGALELVREYNTRCSMDGQLVIIEDYLAAIPVTATFILLNPCQDITSLTAVLSARLIVQTRSNEILTFENVSIAAPAQFYFSDSFDVSKVYKGIKYAQIDLRFEDHSILRTFSGLTTKLKLGPGEPLKNIELTILLANINFQADRDGNFDYLNAFLDANGAASAVITMLFVFENTENIIKNPLDSIVFENNGQLQCSASLNPYECLQILNYFSEIDNSLIQASFIFEFFDNSNSSIYAFSAVAVKINTVCFEDASMRVTREGIDFTLQRMKGSICNIQELTKTGFVLGYYKQYIDKVYNDPSLLEEVVKFVIEEFNQDVLNFRTQLTKEQFADFYKRKDAATAYSYQLLAELNGVIIYNIEITDYSLIDAYSFLRVSFLISGVAGFIVAAVIIVSAVLSTVLKKRPSKKRSAQITDDI